MTIFDHMGVCVKKDGVVNHQNQACEAFCAKRIHTFCTECEYKGAASYPPNETRVRYKIFGDVVRLVVVYKREYHETILQIPVELEIQQIIFDFLTNADLTAQEREIVKMICEGCTNLDIQEILHIAISTLKTHINHILHKLPALQSFRKNIPKFLSQNLYKL